jgi:hypothetical protein
MMQHSRLCRARMLNGLFSYQFQTHTFTSWTQKRDFLHYYYVRDKDVLLTRSLFLRTNVSYDTIPRV